MKRIICAALIGLALESPLMSAQKQINILWVGNSFSGQGICDVGWFEVQWMINGGKDGSQGATSPSGMVVAIHDAMMGATTMAQHWAAKRGLDELVNPTTARNPYGGGSITVDHYDYMVLQPWHLHNDALIRSEADAIGHYCDTILNYGCKPVIFAVWEDTVYAPTTGYAKVVHMYDSIYTKYKPQGALMAPLYTVYQKIWQEKGASFLFGPNDMFEHEGDAGVYINICVFYSIFTKLKSSLYDWNLQKSFCPKIAELDADHAYIENVSDECVSKYIDFGGTSIKNDKIIRPLPLLRKCDTGGTYNLAGKVIHEMNSLKKNGVYIVRNASASKLEIAK